MVKEKPLDPKSGWSSSEDETEPSSNNSNSINSRNRNLSGISTGSSKNSTGRIGRGRGKKTFSELNSSISSRIGSSSGLNTSEVTGSDAKSQGTGSSFAHSGLYRVPGSGSENLFEGATTDNSSINSATRASTLGFSKATRFDSTNSIPSSNGTSNRTNGTKTSNTELKDFYQINSNGEIEDFQYDNLPILKEKNNILKSINETRGNMTPFFYLYVI